VIISLFLQSYLLKQQLVTKGAFVMLKKITRSGKRKVNNTISKKEIKCMGSSELTELPVIVIDIFVNNIYFATEVMNVGEEEKIKQDIADVENFDYDLIRFYFYDAYEHECLDQLSQHHFVETHIHHGVKQAYKIETVPCVDEPNKLKSNRVLIAQLKALGTY
jgi:hypothetical protein